MVFSIFIAHRLLIVTVCHGCAMLTPIVRWNLIPHLSASFANRTLSELAFLYARVRSAHDRHSLFASHDPFPLSGFCPMPFAILGGPDCYSGAVLLPSCRARFLARQSEQVKQLRNVVKNHVGLVIANGAKARPQVDSAHARPMCGADVCVMITYHDEL